MKKSRLGDVGKMTAAAAIEWL